MTAARELVFRLTACFILPRTLFWEFQAGTSTGRRQIRNLNYKGRSRLLVRTMIAGMGAWRVGPAQAV